MAVGYNYGCNLAHAHYRPLSEVRLCIRGWNFMDGYETKMICGTIQQHLWCYFPWAQYPCNPRELGITKDCVTNNSLQAMAVRSFTNPSTPDKSISKWWWWWWRRRRQHITFAECITLSMLCIELYRYGSLCMVPPG